MRNVLWVRSTGWRLGLAGLALAGSLAGAAPALACGGYGDEAWVAIEAGALEDPDPAVVEAAIVRLRAHGAPGLAAALAHRDARAADATAPAPAHALAALDAAIDRIAQQRGAVHARLFWHTDLDAALAEARASERPVLSLRLLGRLTDELSCANSRFFRAVLYAEPDVADVLRERFVLHWSTEREAPVITIDFGDGRKLVRTITGNSIHYVLDDEGGVIDALPGLYAPRAFLAGLERARGVAERTHDLDPAAHAEALVAFHRERLTALEERWVSELEAIGRGGDALRTARKEAEDRRATTAMRISMSKSAVEMPSLERILLDRFEVLEAATVPEAWAAIAARHAEHARVGPRGRAAVVAEAAPDRADAMLARFERSLALDTVRNELELHRQIHAWLADAWQRARPWAVPSARDAGSRAGAAADDGRADVASTSFAVRAALTSTGLEHFNARVYRELFHTPRDDAWLGLHEDDVFTALARGGVHAEAAAPR